MNFWLKWLRFYFNYYSHLHCSWNLEPEGQKAARKKPQPCLHHRTLPEGAQIFITTKNCRDANQIIYIQEKVKSRRRTEKIKHFPAIIPEDSGQNCVTAGHQNSFPLCTPTLQAGQHSWSGSQVGKPAKSEQHGN